MTFSSGCIGCSQDRWIKTWHKSSHVAGIDRGDDLWYSLSDLRRRKTSLNHCFGDVWSEMWGELWLARPLASI